MRSDGDHQDEIREHIAMETQANIDRGMSPEDAERAARITFGSVSGTRQRLYEGRRSYWWSTAAQDIRYAFRAIRRNLQLSCAVVLAAKDKTKVSASSIWISLPLPPPRASHFPLS